MVASISDFAWYSAKSSKVAKAILILSILDVRVRSARFTWNSSCAKALCKTAIKHSTSDNNWYVPFGRITFIYAEDEPGRYVSPDIFYIPVIENTERPRQSTCNSWGVTCRSLLLRHCDLFALPGDGAFEYISIAGTGTTMPMFRQFQGSNVVKLFALDVDFSLAIASPHSVSFHPLVVVVVVSSSFGETLRGRNAVRCRGRA